MKIEITQMGHGMSINQLVEVLDMKNYNPTTMISNNLLKGINKYKKG
jgi:hypothetical protein